MPIHVTCWACNATIARFPSNVRGKRAFCSKQCRYRPLPAILSDDGATALIPLCAQDGSVRAYAVVDAADATWVSQWRWSLLPNGYVGRSEGTHTGKPVMILLHRALLGLVPGDGLEGDHIDRIKANNRRSNLRPSRHIENMQNVSIQVGRRSRHRGVTLDKRSGMWDATMKLNGKKRFLGSFSDEDEAGAAAQAARLEAMPYATD